MISPFYRVRQLAETPSTNDEVRAAAEAGEAEGFVVRALKQSAGRGRLGRTWSSPIGNMYASVLLRPQCELAQISHYAFATALAVYETVRSFLPKSAIELKWPNDVLVGGKKISGILIEAAPVSDGRIGWIIIGCGINVEHFPEQTAYPATCFQDEGAAVNVQAVFEAYLDRLLYWSHILRHESFAPIREKWLLWARKGPISARLSRETVNGDFVSMDNDGCLILRLADGSERRIASGDIFWQESASHASGD